MASIATWGDHTFEITSRIVYGFEELKIKSSRKTEDKEKKNKLYGKQNIAAKKAANPTDVSLKAKLYKALGAEPYAEAQAWLADAHKGTADRLKISGKDAVPCKLILVSAEVSEVSIDAAGEWVSCEVSLSFKSNSVWDKNGGSKSGTTKKKKSSSSSSKRSSTKKKGTTTQSKSKMGTIAAAATKVAANLNKKNSTVTKLKTSGTNTKQTHVRKGRR